jgi:hypothetical protein
MIEIGQIADGKIMINDWTFWVLVILLILA